MYKLHLGLVSRVKFAMHVRVIVAPGEIKPAKNLTFYMRLFICFPNLLRTVVIYERVGSLIGKKSWL